MTREEIALNIACDLLIGSNLYGYDYDRVFEEIMDKEGVVSSLSIKDYILNNLEKLGKEYFVEEKEPEREPCIFKSQDHCAFCVIRSECNEYWKEGEADET